MKMLPIILMRLFMSIPCCRAQDYFPLEVGNCWYLTSIPIYVAGKETIADEEYFKVLRSNDVYTYFRKDEQGNVYEINRMEKEYLKYKMDAEIGDEWIFGQYDVEYTATLASKTETVETDAGTFHDCWLFVYRAIGDVYDADFSQTLAPDIGMVKNFSIGWDSGSYMQKAKLQDRRIPDTSVPLKVERMIPGPGSRDIDIISNVRVDFNYSIPYEKFNASSMIIRSAKQGKVEGSFADSWSTSASVIRFTPDHPFAYDDTVYVSLLKNICDYCGDTFESAIEYSFTTGREIIDSSMFIEAPITVKTEVFTGDIDWADYDKDGDYDLLIVGNKYAGGGAVELYENTENGFVKNTSTLQTIKHGLTWGLQHVRFADYTNDGWLDISYTGTDEDYNTNTYLYSNINGSYNSEPYLIQGFNDASIDWCDMNNDGYPDFALSGQSDYYEPYAEIYINSKGTLSLYDTIKVPHYRDGKIKWIDFDGDGSSDIIVLKRGDITGARFFHNTGTGFETADITVNCDNGYLSVMDICSSDIDLDGDIDILVGSYLLENEGTIFQEREYQLEEFYAGIPAFYDYDNDDDEDIFIGGTKWIRDGKQSIFAQIYKNENGVFTLVESANLQSEANVFSGKWLDFDNDNDLDLTLLTGDGMKIYLNEMNETFVENFHDVTRETIDIITFPNPFNSSVNISYMISGSGEIKLSIYSITGQLVREFDRDFKPAGTGHMVWDGRDNAGSTVASGLYFVRLNAGGHAATRKIMFMK